MRMDSTRGETAESWINRVDEKTLATVFKEYGEERFSKRIANAVIKSRDISPIKTTKQLADIITKANPQWEKHKHPATRCFQAIRIFINRELDDLKDCLEQSLSVLKKGGRIVVISFHSLEDRIVKQFIKQHEKGAHIPKGLPIKDKDMFGQLKSIGRAIKPSDKEIEGNPRARSAVLRIAEKIA
jgi:16S rRNA (cytosine1402-N4)-methyltransferase